MKEPVKCIAGSRIYNLDTPRKGVIPVPGMMEQGNGTCHHAP